MGVHGLTRHIKSLGLDATTNAAAAVEIKEGSTLCIDGDGLLFHLFHKSYLTHHANVSADQSKLLQSQLLLPLFTPLSLIHDVTTSYLSELTLQHGMNLQIYFDGPDQFMKSRQRGRRQQRRNEEWENVRQLCIHGILPETGPAKSRSAARRQARTQHSLDVAANGSDDAEFFLSCFPFGKLAFHQIRQSIREFAHISSVLFRGSIQLVNCDGEADVAVARASTSGTSAYAVANDTDYFIYGKPEKVVKYICFDQLKPSEETLRGNVQTRSEVSSRIGLLHEEAMIELSIILGNDYTGPLLRHERASTQKKYWSSLRWQRDGEQETLPNEMSNDVQDVIHRVGERVAEGWSLTSTVEELKVAIEYSYALYSFESTESFRSRVNTLDVDVGDDVEEENATEEMFPDFPQRLHEYVTRTSSCFDVETDLFEAATSPLTLYMSEVGDYFVEEKHLDALKMVLETRQLQSHNPMKLPRHQFHWKDIQAVFILEKLMLRVISGSSGANTMPYKFFDHLLFFSYLESISFDDSPLNDVAMNGEEDITNIFPEDKPGKKLVLPIDKHKKEILNAIKTQRVTIIHGETGCGKSSRVPCFLLRAEPPQPSLAAPEVKMIVSQPRRIAAKALAERVRKVEPDIAHKIALRMGHGMKEFESHKTRAWFVTTGYVVRLLANHPHWFDSHTHLIIDEVHERSVDSDILCLLCRRLLHSHPTIRLVLMSATLAADLYSQYFGAPQPIHVGVRRFPINEYFVEDLESQLSLSTKHAQYAQDIYDFCEKSRCSAAPPDAIKDKSFHLASQITASVGQHGSSVLIFVAGMSDIEAISELIERLNVRNVTFTCFPIHSDIPFEEQMEAFESPKEGEVKVVIATNAAESSVTLPDVDHVICLGLCKQIVYNKSSHRQQLIPTWISRASATQRAGRTGRVRCGNVYRLYSRDAYNEYFASFEAGEILRSPLDSVILNLRDMLNEKVTEILLECLEAPDLSTIERSFQSLHSSNFISRPDDEGEITSLGELVVALGIDLKLGALVGLGIQFGIPAESIELAGILSFPKAPWAISSPMYHDSATFNDLVSTTFTSRCYFDAGLYSEPMATSNLLFDYSKSRKKDLFCRVNRLSGVRMRHLASTVKNLQSRVAERLDIRPELLEMTCPFYDMHPTKVALLRIIQTWLFYDTMMVQIPSFPCNQDKSVAISIDGPQVKRSHLEQILDETHAFQIENRGRIVQQGHFDGSEFKSDPGNYMETFTLRFISYMLEKEVDFSFCCVGGILNMIVPTDVWQKSQLLRDTIIGMLGARIKTVVFQGNTGSGNQRGVRGRACGAWYPESIGSNAHAHIPTKSVTILSSEVTKQDLSLFKKEAEIMSSNSNYSIKSVVCTEIKETKKKVSYTITSLGDCSEISKIDLVDLFADTQVQSTAWVERLKQSIIFEPDDNVRNSPLIADGPEGARLLSVLASERRKDNFIRLQNGNDEIDINIPRTLSINGKKRWKRKSGSGTVYVQENSVCSAVLPLDEKKELFACCANTLELRGGACKVEGVTLLPPGRLFCGLALLSFGINPQTCSALSLSNDDKKKDDGLGKPVQDALSWTRFSNGIENSDEWRVKEALKFHMGCMELGETLECQPEKIKTLCVFFDGVNGPMDVWEGYDTSLTDVNASLRRKSKVQKRGVPKKGQKNGSSEHLFDTEDHHDSNTTFICPGCNDAFHAIVVCKDHMQSCCFGLVRDQEPIPKTS